MVGQLQRKMTWQLVLGWILFALLSLLCGVAASTITFTAWGLIVPLMLNILKFDIYSTLFTAAFLDFINSGLLTVIYALEKKVAFVSGTAIGLVQALCAVFVALLTWTVLERYQNILKGGVSVVPFIIGIFFLIKVVITVWKSRRRKKLDKNDEVEMKEQIEMQKIETQEEIEMQEQNTSSEISNSSDKDIKGVEEFQKRNLHLKILNRCSAEKEANLFSTNISKRWLRILLLILVAMLNGSLGGFLYISGGMNINIAMMILFQMKLGYSTATSCWITTITTFALCLLFIGRQIFTLQLLYIMTICVPLSICGALIGAIFMLNISDLLIYMLITVTMLILGTLSTIVYFIKSPL